MRQLTEECGVGTSVEYDWKEQKDKLLKFYSNNDDQKLMKNIQFIVGVEWREFISEQQIMGAFN